MCCSRCENQLLLSVESAVIVWQGEVEEELKAMDFDLLFIYRIG